MIGPWVAFIEAIQVKTPRSALPCLSGIHHQLSGIHHPWQWKKIVALLRFTHPGEDSPRPDRDFRVVGAEIVLRTEDVRDLFSVHLVQYTLNRKDRRQRTGHRYDGLMRMAELVGRLAVACEQGKDLIFTEGDGRHYVDSYSSFLVPEKRFVHAKCKECAEEFLPEVCQVLNWAVGEGLAAEGGRRVLCPAGHTFYSCFEWNS